MTIDDGMNGVGHAPRPADRSRRVALTLLLSRPEVGSLGRARLLREAQALAKLSHPNVVTVYEVGEWSGHVYVAMELIEGRTLRGWLKLKRWGWRDVVDKLLQAGRGLAAAHKVGIIHRDFKPSNVLVGTDGRVRVLDFGLALAPGSSLPDVPMASVGRCDSPSRTKTEAAISVAWSDRGMLMPSRCLIWPSPMMTAAALVKPASTGRERKFARKPARTSPSTI